MGTAEILIVFSALMALIALVTIGIDWIGKPLKNRRFIPRIYRFDDEKLPVDAYGNTTFGPPVPASHATAPVVHHQPPQASPRRVARVSAKSPKVEPAAAGAHGPGPQVAAHAAVAAASTQTAFSDSLALSSSASSGSKPDRALIAGTEPTPPPAPNVSSAWKPGMALDTSVDDRKPSLATKAERFWMTAAEAMGSIGTSHFDDDDIARMAAGKAPRRTNPRTGRPEAMQLTGLRRASTHADVRMRWPDDSVDPWNAS